MLQCENADCEICEHIIGEEKYHDIKFKKTNNFSFIMSLLETLLCWKIYFLRLY